MHWWTLLLTLNDDVRVILIKIADRLHNMRTMDSMSYEKQIKTGDADVEVVEHVKVLHQRGGGGAA